MILKIKKIYFSYYNFLHFVLFFRPLVNKNYSLRVFTSNIKYHELGVSSEGLISAGNLNKCD